MSLRERGCVYHPVRALERVRAILWALAKVHDRGIVHCDVKPANLLRFGDDVKVCDFGTGREAEPAATEANEGFVGTRDYAAPEQVRGEGMDARSDLYAVGCILYEMLTGEIANRKRTEAVSPTYPNALVLPELDRLVRRFLAPDRSSRPRDAMQAMGLVDSVLASYAAARQTWLSLGLGECPY
jgi:serine/threonine-protein kinase